MIQLIVKKTSNDFFISIDGKDVPFVVDDNTVKISTNLDLGIHTLEIINGTGELEILDVILDGTNLRSAIYVSWTLHQGQRHCPATKLWEPGQRWVLPFCLPAITWLSTVTHKFGLKQFGKNLFESYEIFIPERREIQGPYPKPILDFFNYDNDFHCYSIKERAQWSNNLHIPYVETLFEVDTKALMQEVLTLFDAGQVEAVVPAQTSLNNKEFDSNDDFWNIFYLVKKEVSDTPWRSRAVFDSAVAPNLCKFLDQLPVEKLMAAYIARTPARGYAYPHVDYIGEEGHSGLSVLYVPLDSKPGHYFKLHKVGLVPQNSPTIINNKQFMHSVINDTDEPRYVLGVTAVWKPEAGKYLKW